MDEPEKKKRGRPKMSEEDKRRRKLERLGYVTPTDPTPPPAGGKSKNGGIGGDKRAVASSIVAMAHAGMKVPRVDTYDENAIMERFEMYLTHCEEQGVVPSMEGVYNWLGIGRTMWHNIINQVDGYIRGDNVVAVMHKIKDTMGEIVTGAAGAGLMNPAVAVLVMTNTFGYRDVKQVEHSNEVNVNIGGAALKELVDKYKPEEYIAEDIVETTYAESDTQDDVI